ncbi:hypothetical protein IF1G_11192 [Cordyceps javanica]|uniref:Uncharacterized protein n=1 Tax=Cordyceps javanica TaxID=43265 RepID=A0A545VIT7_9HYPO|nr:hypothetical protein IF1G_11192 [Cordyceps javanica]TQW01644.1 hypothetical protein IF2G_10841 [Cordyceps javanica]
MPTPFPYLFDNGKAHKYVDTESNRMTIKDATTLEFTPNRQTDIDLPYTIDIELAYKHDSDSIELTASYGGLFHEQRSFVAPIVSFRFPETERYGKRTTATLGIDRDGYEENGCLDHTVLYIVPRSSSIWCEFMKGLRPSSEETVFVALAGTCKAEDDYYYVSENQDQQSRNLLQRFPPEARDYIIKTKLAGKTRGPYSKMANQPSGPKD